MKFPSNVYAIHVSLGSKNISMCKKVEDWILEKKKSGNLLIADVKLSVEDPDLEDLSSYMMFAYGSVNQEKLTVSLDNQYVQLSVFEFDEDVRVLFDKACNKHVFYSNKEYYDFVIWASKMK